MTALDLDALEQKARAATSGEWTACVDAHAPGNGKRVAWVESEDSYVADVPNGPHEGCPRREGGGAWVR